MMAWQRIASLFLLLAMGGCTSATDPSPASVPLDTPPDTKQIVRAAIQMDKASQKKPDKKPTAKDAAKEANAAVKTEKIDDKAGQRAGAPTHITRIPAKYGWSEISRPRAVNALTGWAWQVCLKGKNKNSVIYMAVFMQHNSIVDMRTATEPDKCEGDTYEPL